LFWYAHFILFHHKHLLSCLPSPGNIWYCIVMPHAWWMSGLQKYTGINKKCMHSMMIHFVFSMLYLHLH
jgi:hypothetical protein